MKIVACKIPDILIIEPIKHNDARGSFMESYRYDLLSKYNIKEFVQDNLVCSEYGVLRGMHYQVKHPQDKLIQVIDGEIFDVAIDIRKKSPTYGQWFGEYLSSKNRKQLFIPAGFAHGYCVTSNIAKVLYKCNDYYYSDDQYGIIWNDITLNINWPIKNPILSEKDIKLSSFQKKMK